jgi:hypothetical protein
MIPQTAPSDRKAAECPEGDKKTQTHHRPSCTKQPALKKICANLRNLRIKNVCYQSVTGYPMPPLQSCAAVVF